MEKQIFGIGLIGVQAGRSWASVSHIPALQALQSDFRIVGIANTSLASAQKAVETEGVGQAFASVDELIASPEIDVVVVTVKVPHHYKIVMAALTAGKHVYCEWPIGNGLEEAREMASLARKKGVLAVAGTQARVAPAMLHVRDLIASGYVGEVLSTTLIGSGMNWGPTIDEVNAYTLDVETGASMLTIPFGHTMAAVVDVLGDVVSVSAELATRRKMVQVVDTGELKPMTVADQVVVAGLFNNGAPFAIHYRGGDPHGTGLLWEINGTKGDIQVTGTGGHTQLVELTVRGATGDEQTLSKLPLPEALRDPHEFNPIVGNVARMYKKLAGDLRENTRTAPTFDDAVKTHRLIAAVEMAARDGRKVIVNTL